MRNRIRHELLPLLETYNPGIRELLVRNGELLADDEAYLEAQTQAAWAEVAEWCGDSLRLHRQPLLGPQALRHRLYRAAVHRLTNTEATLEARHIVALNDSLVVAIPAAYCSSGDLRASLTYDALVFRRECYSVIVSIWGIWEDHAGGTAWPRPFQRSSTTALHQRGTLSVPGVAEMPEIGWRIRAWRIEGVPGNEDAGELPPAPEMPSLSFADPARRSWPRHGVYLDASTIGESLTVRVEA